MGVTSTALNVTLMFFDAPKPVPVTVTESPGIPRVGDREIEGVTVNPPVAPAVLPVETSLTIME